MFLLKTCFGFQFQGCRPSCIDEVSREAHVDGTRPNAFGSDDQDIPKPSKPEFDNKSKSIEAFGMKDDILDHISVSMRKDNTLGVTPCVIDQTMPRSLTHRNILIDRQISLKSGTRMPIKQVNRDILHLQQQYEVLLQSFDTIHSSMADSNGFKRSPKIIRTSISNRHRTQQC